MAVERRWELSGPPLLGVVLEPYAPRLRVDVDAARKVSSQCVGEAFGITLAVEVFRLLRSSRELAPPRTIGAVGSFLDARHAILRCARGTDSEHEKEGVGLVGQSSIGPQVLKKSSVLRTETVASGHERSSAATHICWSEPQ